MHVFVTGGTGALGTAVVRRFLQRDNVVTATWVIPEEAEQLITELGSNPRLATVEANALDAESLDGAISSATQRFGDIDALVHLVGGWSGGASLPEHDPGMWRRMMDLNLTSAFLACRAVLPGMVARGGGRIVLISSRSALMDRKGQSAYAVAKAGLVVLAETIAEETKGTDVTANVVAPSTLDTPANRKSMPDSNHSRWVSLDEVARSIGFLASEGASSLRGALLPVFGGV